MASQPKNDWIWLFLILALIFGAIIAAHVLSYFLKP